jgi:hypothetical protein
MNVPYIVEALTPVIDILEELGVAYYIGGSMASSVYGTARATLDVDLVADLHSEHVQRLVDRLQATYYIDPEMVADAIEHRTSFNLIHIPSMMKVDVFIPKAEPFDRIAFGRVRQDTLSDSDEPRLFYLASPEDIVLRKLDWYKAGGPFPNASGWTCSEC